jgi:hypothetical protein
VQAGIPTGQYGVRDSPEHHGNASVDVPGPNGVVGPCACAGELVKLAPPRISSSADTMMRSICILQNGRTVPNKNTSEAPLRVALELHLKDYVRLGLAKFSAGWVG